MHEKIAQMLAMTFVGYFWPTLIENSRKKSEVYRECRIWCLS